MSGGLNQILIKWQTKLHVRSLSCVTKDWQVEIKGLIGKSMRNKTGKTGTNLSYKRVRRVHYIYRVK